jgi:hypothetical protein
MEGVEVERHAFFDLGTRWRCDQLHAPDALPQGRPQCPLDRRLGVPQNRSGRVIEKKKMLSPHRESNPDHAIVQPVTSHFTDLATPTHQCIGYRVHEH